MPAVTTVDDIEERGLQRLRNRSRLAFTDAAIVHFADRRDLCGRAGEEGLISDIELVPRSAASCMIVSRVIPSRMDVSGGVLITPFRTMNTFSPLPSAT